MTMLSISDAFKDLGHDIHFIIADNRVSKLINKRGYEALVLNSDYKSMEEWKWPQDIQPDILIVDSYYVTDRYLRRLKEKVKKLVYLDDILFQGCALLSLFFNKDLTNGGVGEE